MDLGALACEQPVPGPEPATRLSLLIGTTGYLPKPYPHLIPMSGWVGILFDVCRVHMVPALEKLVGIDSCRLQITLGNLVVLVRLR